MRSSFLIRKCSEIVAQEKTAPATRLLPHQPPCDILANGLIIGRDVMKKSQKTKAAGPQYGAMFGDIFGLKTLKSKKGRMDKNRVPWQWALWAALIFFIIGFLMPTDSIWILLVAVAAAVIFYIARSTETVEEQVLLLTDERTPEQKEAHRKREAAAKQKTAPKPRRPRTRQTAPISRPAPEAAEEAQTPAAQTAAKPAKAKKPAPRKPRVAKAQTENKAVAQVNNEAAEPAPAGAEESKAPAKKSATRKPRSTKRPSRKPRQNGTKRAAATKASKPATDKPTGETH